MIILIYYLSLAQEQQHSVLPLRGIGNFSFIEYSAFIKKLIKNMRIQSLMFALNRKIFTYQPLCKFKLNIELIG